jgi:hypothetical protein
VLALAGCGGSSHHTSTPAAVAATGSNTPTAAAAASIGTSSAQTTASGLHTIATAGGADGSTTLTETYELGPIDYGSDASAAGAALQACGQYALANPPTNA